MPCNPSFVTNKGTAVELAQAKGRANDGKQDGFSGL
jgi:hypothetical protein